MRKLLILLTVLIMGNIYSKSIYLTKGSGYNHTANTNLYSVEISDKIRNHFTYKYKVAYLQDLGHSKSGFYETLQLGTNWNISKHIELTWFSGVGIQTLKDKLNGSYFEFYHDGRIIIKDSVFIGISHISNAGIVKPNMGRDFIELGMRLNL